MLVPLHIGLNHTGPVLLIMAAGAVIWTGLWYVLRSAGFRAEEA